MLGCVWVCWGVSGGVWGLLGSDGCDLSVLGTVLIFLFITFFFLVCLLFVFFFSYRFLQPLSVFFLSLVSRFLPTSFRFLPLFLFLSFSLSSMFSSVTNKSLFKYFTS